MHSDLARQPVPRTWSAVDDAEVVTVTVDGQEIQAPKGMLLIEAAERHGVYIPRFCWHNRMKPVAMCRMCMVQVEGMRGLPTACTVPIADGMKVDTQGELVQKAQDGVLEFLLINHPLDCPVCDRGGECPLQDQTLIFGPGESRFVEEKRHYEKPIALSSLVLLDRERCVQCARCTRFGEEISGDPLIDFVERSGRTQVLTFPEQPFSSYFSGNTVQICPVGALTAAPYRFRARPWDLQASESTCTLCSVGCRMEVQSSSDRVVRHLGVDSDAVNHSWLCDKGRFGFEFLSDPDRLTTSLVKDGASFRDASWPDALDMTASRLAAAQDRVGVLGGARGTNESAYALARFARDVLGTADIDCQLGDGLPASFVAGIPSERRASINDLERARCVLVVGPDLKEELPVLFLRVRRAATALGATLVEVHPRDTGLTLVAGEVIRHRPGEAASVLDQLAGDAPDNRLNGAHAALRSGPAVVIVGRQNLAEDPAPLCAAALRLVESLPEARLLPVLRRGNAHGAIDVGCAPDVGPGRQLPPSRGRDAAEILTAAADGELDALVLVGSNPLADFPDTDLALAALDRVGFLVALDLFLTDSVREADVVFPTVGYAEQDGTVTNLEGRVTRLRARVTPPGRAIPDWAVIDQLARRLGHDLGFESAEAIGRAMVSGLPSWKGVRPWRLGRGQAHDGQLLGEGTLRYPPEAAGPPTAPAFDAYGVRVLTGRALYDNGDQVSRCPSLSRLAPSAHVALHPRELTRLGLADGDDVVLRNGKATLTLPARSDPGTPEGVGYIPFPHAAPLISVGEAVTEARLETVS